MEKGDRGSSENGIAPTGRGRLIVQAGAIVAATAATLGLLVWIAGRQAPTSGWLEGTSSISTTRACSCSRRR